MDNIGPSMEQFDANDLLIFARVAEFGSFSKAAERLGLPKSTVSRRISQLENRLGERLMQRTTRRLALTEFGQGLLDHARLVADEVEAVVAFAAYRQARPSGRLRVSMPADFAHLLLVDMLATFAAQYPAVALDLDLSPRHVDLLGENFDVALRMGELPDDTTLAARRIAEFPHGLYAAPTYLAKRGDLTAPDQLAEHDSLRLLGRDGNAGSWTLLRGETRWEGVPAGRLNANSPELLIRLALAGAGIAAVPDYFATVHVQQGTLRRVLPDWCLPVVTAWAVFPGRRLMPAKTRAFIDMLLAALAGRFDAQAAYRHG